MNQNYWNKIKARLLCSLLLIATLSVQAQQSVIVNLGPIDGVDITPDNIFGFQVQSPVATNAQIKGTLRYRGSNRVISYNFSYPLRQGMNQITGDMIHPNWQFSSSALQELFLDYKKLPEGTYEYCVTVTLTSKLNGEALTGASDEQCLYHKSEDLFLINLADPENNAKIHEYNPMLSWIVNYPFASALTYRIRVAEIKQGQNPQNAVTRNNPVYDESGIVGNTITYPVYAKPLQVNQPYAWTVDAYFRGILLGGAEFWKFTIVEDSLLKAVPPVQAYYDFEKHNNDSKIFAVGTLKLKYESKAFKDTLKCKLFDEHRNAIKFPQSTIALLQGENKIDINFDSTNNLKHEKSYYLQVSTKQDKTYTISFIYINPLYLKN